MIRLDIGCSFHKKPGYIGVDIESGPDVDIIADMAALPFKDSSIHEIHTRHTLEHVENPLQCISELYRVTNAEGKMVIIVPHYSNSAYWADLTHLRPFSARTFQYFDLDYCMKSGFPIYLPKINLKIEKVILTYWPDRITKSKTLFKRSVSRFLNRMLSYLASKNPFLCERIWCSWVGGFYEVEFHLKVIKSK